ncbi:MAG: phosphate ABC transporter permease subunit PstC [Actinobacteria bacterium]|nr:MAG: phosphate ABC transporter permease subunit PstC [Actinomycetota bacterium]
MSVLDPEIPIHDRFRQGGTGRGERVARIVVVGGGIFVLALIVAILIFLLIEARPAFTTAGWSFFTTKVWFPDNTPPVFGVAALVFGTVLSSLIAVVIAALVAIGAALFIVEVAPTRVGRPLGYVIDLLAAVPSVVFGLWGLVYVVPRLIPVGKWLNSWFGWFPLFSNPGQLYGRSIFAASVILAIMVLPIIAAVSREVFRQTPTAHKEAAVALGATRWEMIRMAVFPYSRSGLVGAIILGLGRALGETIAVALVLAPSFVVNTHILQPGNNTIAANIATKFGEAGSLGREALIASGLVLFAITLVVNIGARAFVRAPSFGRGGA